MAYFIVNPFLGSTSISVNKRWMLSNKNIHWIEIINYKYSIWLRCQSCGYERSFPLNTIELLCAENSAICFFFCAFDSFICRNAYVTKWWLIVWQYDSNKSDSVIDGMTTACSPYSTNRQIWEIFNPKSTCVRWHAYIAYALSFDRDGDGNGFYRHSRRR